MHAPQWAGSVSLPHVLMCTHTYMYMYMYVMYRSTVPPLIQLHAYTLCTCMYIHVHVPIYTAIYTRFTSLASMLYTCQCIYIYHVHACDLHVYAYTLLTLFVFMYIHTIVVGHSLSLDPLLILLVHVWVVEQFLVCQPAMLLAPLARLSLLLLLLLLLLLVRCLSWQIYPFLYYTHYNYVKQAKIQVR